MKNPWKQMSDVNPQTERGSRRIASDLFAAITFSKFSSVEYQIINTVIHLTWGFRKTEAEISYRDFRFFTGRSRASIIRNTCKLVHMRILVKTTKLVNGRLPVNTYMLNKYYDTWITISSIPLLTSSHIKLVQKYTSNWSKSGSPTGTRKYTPTYIYNNNKYKGPVKKEIAPTEIDSAGMALLNDLGINPPKIDLQKSHKRKSAETDNDDFEF